MPSNLYNYEIVLLKFVFWMSTKRLKWFAEFLVSCSSFLGRVGEIDGVEGRESLMGWMAGEVDGVEGRERLMGCRVGRGWWGGG